MSNIQEWLQTVGRSQDEVFTLDSPATPSVVADATPRPPLPLDTLFDCMSISASNPTPPSLKPVAGLSVPSPPRQRPEDDAVTDHAASENTLRGEMLFRKHGDTLKFRYIPPSEQEQEKEQEPEPEPEQDQDQDQDQEACIVAMERKLQEMELALEKVMNMRPKKTSRSVRRTIDASNVPEDSFSSVRRTKKSDPKWKPYSHPRDSEPKRKKHVRFPRDGELERDKCRELPPLPLACIDLQYDGRSYACPPARVPELPTLRDHYPEYRPPTPHPSAMEMPSDDMDEEGLVPTTPQPAEIPALGLYHVDSGTVVQQVTLEKIDNTEDDDDCASVVAQADAHDVASIADHPVTSELLDEAHALLTNTFAELQSANAHCSPDDDAYSPVETSPTYLTPARSTPGLYTEHHRELSPVESPFPKTPISPPDGLDSQVVVRSPKPPGYEETFGTSDDEDNDNLLPNPRSKSEKTATTENAETAPSAPAPAPTESVVTSDIPAQTSLPPSSTMAPQREMSWTALPVSSLPATTQYPQFQPAPAFTHSPFAPAQYQASPTSFWPQNAVSAPAVTSTRMAPTPPAPSLSAWVSPPQFFYQPIAIPQLPSFVHGVAPPQPDVDMSMDVDSYVDVVPSRPIHQRARPARGYRRAAHDHRRAARQLLRVAAIEPSLHLPKRVARCLFQHLFVIRQRPTTIHAFRGDRAVRRGLVVQRRNRQVLRRARRSVWRTLKRLGRAARPGRGAPQPLQPSMSVEMAIESSQTGLFDQDVDMDGGDLPATEVATEIMASESAFPSFAPLIPSGSSIPVDLPIPIIIITPDSPQPQPHSQAELRAEDSAPPLAVSFVVEPTATVAFGSAKHAVEYPPREESSLAEFEVPLVEAAAPVPVIDPEPIPVAEAVIEASGPSEDDAGEMTDDETEWEFVPIPVVAINPPATPTAEPAPLEESTPPAESAPVEQQTPTEARAPAALPAPNVAGQGPEIIFHSGKPRDEDAEDAVSLGCSEEERENQVIYGEDGEGYDDEEDNEDYEDDGEEEDDETDEEDDEEEDEEDNEYDESAPINPAKRPSPPAPAPPSAPVSSPAVGAAPVTASAPSSTPLPIPSTLPLSSAPTSLTSGPHIGIVMEGYNPAADIRRQLLADQANVSSGNRLSGAAAQEERAQARLRNHAHQAQKKKVAQDLIQSVAGKATPAPEVVPVPSPTPSRVPFETTPPRFHGEASTRARVEDELVCRPCGQDRVMAEMHVDADAEEGPETVSPRPDKGKGRATDWDTFSVARAPEIDASVQEIIGGLDLSPAEVRLNLDAFSSADSKGEATLSYQCSCSYLSHGPSSGHTLACQNARGVRTTPLAPKPSSDSGFESPIAPSSLGTYHNSKSSGLEVSPQAQLSPSVLKTEVNTTPVDQGERQTTQPSICFPTAPFLAADEKSTQVVEFVQEDVEQQLTCVAKAWADAFAAPIQASTAVQSVPGSQDLWVSAPDSTVQPLHASTLPPATIDPSVLDLSAELQKMLDAILPGTSTSDNAAMDKEMLFAPAETAPFAGLDFSTLAFGPDADLALDEQLRDLLFSVPDQANAIFIDDLIVYDSVPQDVASVLPVSASVDGISVVFSQVNEGSITASRAGDQEEMREVDAGSVSCPLATPSNDEQQDQHSEASALGYACLEEKPQLESNIPVLAAGSPQVDSRMEPSVQEPASLQPQPASEQSLPADWVPPPLVDLAGPFPPARAPTPPPSVTQDGVAHLVAGEHTEEPEHVDGAPSPASKQEAEDGSSASDVSVPSTPLVRRRSGGPHDRVACPHERRTYYGPRPCSTQWRAFLQACPSRVNRLPSWNVANKSLSPLSSPAARSPAHSCGPSRLRTTSTLPETSTIAEPWHSRLPSRGRPRRRPTALTAMDDQFKSKKDVATHTTNIDVTAATTKNLQNKGKGKSKKGTHAPPSSSSSAPHPPRLTPSDLPSPPRPLRLPSWVKSPCCPQFSRTGREPCIHVLRAAGQLAGTRWESESPESDLEEEKDVSWPQGWSACYLAKLSLAVGACYLLENVVF